MTSHSTAVFNVMLRVLSTLLTVLLLLPARSALRCCTSSLLIWSSRLLPKRGNRWVRKMLSLASTPLGFCRLAWQ